MARKLVKKSKEDENTGFKPEAPEVLEKFLAAVAVATLALSSMALAVSAEAETTVEAALPGVHEIRLVGESWPG